MAQIAPQQRKHSKVVDGRMMHYDEVRHEPIVRYEPINPNKPELGIKPIPDVMEVPVDPDIEGVTKYWQPEQVNNPGCNHEFKILDIRKREIECMKNDCRLGVTFHVTENYIEENGKPFVILNKAKYPIS